MFWECKVAPGAAIRSSRNALYIQSRAFLLTGSLLIVLGMLGGCGRNDSASQETQDTYQVRFATEPASPLTGDGTIIVTVKDESGLPVDGARLSIEANMNHAGMVPVYADATGSQSGVYRLPLTWTMGGAWYVDVKITTTGGQIIRRHFPVNVK